MTLSVMQAATARLTEMLLANVPCLHKDLVETLRTPVAPGPPVETSGFPHFSPILQSILPDFQAYSMVQ